MIELFINPISNLYLRLIFSEINSSQEELNAKRNIGTVRLGR